MDDDPIIRTPEVSKLTGAPPGTVRYWDHTGRGPRSFKLGGRRVWRKSEVLRWIAEQEQETGRGGFVA
jgi:predicted DNA-binding transcriptional regulator AlpA